MGDGPSVTRRGMNVRTLFVTALSAILGELFDVPPDEPTLANWTDSELKTALDWAQAEYLTRQALSLMPHNPLQKPSVLKPFR